MSSKIIQQLSTNWQQSLLENSITIKELETLRGIKKESLKAFELGLVKVPSPADLPDNIGKALQSFGVMNSELNGMVSMPLRLDDSRITNFLMLSLNGVTDRILRKGGLVNLKAFSVFKSIIAVDNLDDFLFCFQNVKENVVPLIQSDRMLDDFTRAVKINNVSEITLLNNSPRWEYLKPRLKDTGVKIYDITLPEGRSVKETLADMSANKLIAYLEAGKAKAAGNKKVQEELAPKEENLSAESNLPEVEPVDDLPQERLALKESPGELRFSAGDRTYRIRGFNRDGFEKLVQMSLEMDGRTFPDKVDLSRSQSRGRFANIAGAEFEASAEMIREDLAFIYQKLDDIQSRIYSEKAGFNIVDKHIITPKDEHRAIDILTARDILNETLIRDTEKLGFVGEEINKKLYYLSAVSRLTGKPLSVLVISSSGSGKSYGLSTVMNLLPPEDVLKYSRITQNALYYKNENELTGRALYLEEMVGMEEAFESLRMLISSGELAVSVPEKDPRTGVMRTVERRIRVDIPVLSSGTRDLWDDESLSRFLVTYNDETLGHRQEVLKKQAYLYTLEGEKANLNRDRILKKHRDIQRVLDPEIAVVNPYADRIMINPDLHIATRKQEQYLRIIYNIAFLRQHRKKKQKAEDRSGNDFMYIEADKDDIITANEIALHVFRYEQGDLTRSLHEAYLKMKSLVEKQVKDSRVSILEKDVTKKELMDEYRWPESTARHYLTELLKHEYVVRVKRSRSRQYGYRLLLTEEGFLEGLNLLDPGSLQ